MTDQVIHFYTRSGLPTVERSPQGYVMDFPADEIHPMATPPQLEKALGAPVPETWQGRSDLMAVIQRLLDEESGKR